MFKEEAKHKEQIWAKMNILTSMFLVLLLIVQRNGFLPHGSNRVGLKNR